MKQTVTRFALLLAIALAVPAPIARAAAPDAQLRDVAAEVTDLLKQEPGRRSADPARLAALVETRILPMVDFVQMTRLAMARNWRLATPEQQGVLAEEFKTLLVRTYTPKLALYRGETVAVKELQAVPHDSDVTVRSEVNQPGKARMSLDYEMRNSGGEWKVYDVKIGGECLVNTYRDLFAEKIRAGGVDGLIKFLEEGNREGGSKLAAITHSLRDKAWIIYAIIHDMVRGGLQ